LKQADHKKKKTDTYSSSITISKEQVKAAVGADSLTIGAPMAIFSLDDSNRIPF